MKGRNLLNKLASKPLIPYLGKKIRISDWLEKKKRRHSSESEENLRVSGLYASDITLSI